MRRLGGIRLRLALAISVTTLVAVVLSFFALERGTEQDLKHRIDSELTAQHRQFEAQVQAANVRTAPQLQKVVRRFVAGQRYRPTSQILLITVKGYAPNTNQQQVLKREYEREREHGSDGDGDEGSSPPTPVTPQTTPPSTDDHGGESGSGDDHGGDSGGDGDGGGGEDGAIRLPFEGIAQADDNEHRALPEAPLGFSTIETSEAGHVRVLTKPILGVNGRRLGTYRAADPLASVELTREGLRNTFLIVGLVALLISVAVAIWLANLITRPLRRMARFASDVDAGDLTQRLHFPGRGTGDEVERLAESFDSMLDRLEAAFKRQQDFVSDASHELRTPLTVLRGQIEVLARSNASNEDVAATSRVLLGEIERMNRLVDDMLVLAKAEEGTLVQKRPVDVADYFEDLRRDLPLLGDRDFEVRAPQGGAIEVDPDRIAQVLRNLVRNAVAHTQPNGKIVVSAQPSGTVLDFAVSDDGPGIPPDQLNRIFDRFHRTDSGRARDEGGSGLGLAIARAIVEAHGGRIWAESPPGHGATIRFQLPGYIPAAQATPKS